MRPRSRDDGDLPRRYAVLDIGTNSIKMIVASVTRGRVDVHHFARIPARAGEGLDRTGRISAAAARRTASAVAALTAEAHAHGAQEVIAVGTYAFRAAKNGRAVARAIGRRAGVRVRILTGTEEARYVLAAIRARIPRRRPNLIAVDVGGGSAQLVAARGSRTIFVRSVPLGAVVLTERHLHHDPIDPAEYGRLLGAVDPVVSRLFAQLPHLASAATELAISGGAATTAAVMAGVRPRRGGYSIPVAMLARLEVKCLARTIAQRRRMPGMQPDRADIMPAGLAVLLSFARHARKRSVRVVEGGWREGIILERAQTGGRSRKRTRSTARAAAAVRQGR